MKKIALVTGAALALGVAGVSSAAALATPGSNTGTIPGAYIGVGAGIGGMDTPKLSAAQKALGGNNYSEELRGFAARVYGGYLWAMPQVQNLQLGAELGYNYYPKNKYSLGPNKVNKWDYSGYNIDLLGVAKYNFGTSGFNALVKAGPTYVRQKFSGRFGTAAAYPGTVISKSKGQVKAEVAAGVGYDINQNVDINLIYAHVFGSKPTENFTAGATQKNVAEKVASVNTLLLNIAYHFGNLGGIV